MVKFFLNFDLNLKTLTEPVEFSAIVLKCQGKKEKTLLDTKNKKIFLRKSCLIAN